MEESIFPFTDRKALQVQDDTTCESIFKDFWERLDSADQRANLPKEKLAKVKESIGSVAWLASYACVILFRRLNSRYSSVVLIGLDGWKYVVHASVHGREATASPDVSKPAYFDLGRVVTDDIADILKKFHKTLSESERNNTGNQRGQSAGHQGNQKTPSFVRTILHQTILAFQSDKGQPSAGSSGGIQGGTTDVGLHTGCIIRNTSYPLVLSLVHELLKMEGEQDDDLFYKCSTVYLMSYLIDVSFSVKDYEQIGINRVITIIREIETFFGSLEDDYFKKFVLGVVKEHRWRMDDLRPRNDSTSQTMLTDQSIEEVCQGLRPPKFPSIPDLTSDDHDEQSKMDRAKADALKNLGFSNLLSYDFTGKLQDSHVQVARLNVFFWKIALELGNDDIHYDIGDLTKKLNCYLEHMALVQKSSEKTTYVMTCVLRSEELLASWICCCWAHRKAEEKHPIFRDYGSALDAGELEHIALSDSRAMQAVNCVTDFIRARVTSVHPFRDKKQSTLELATAFGRGNQHFIDIHKNELDEASRLIEERWRKIVKKQQMLSELDSKLVTAEYELQQASHQHQISKANDYDYNRRGQKEYHSIFYTYAAELEGARRAKNSLVSQICDIERKPATLVLGLPRDRDRAFLWLFFCFMPKEFCELAALVQISQSKLWENPPKEKLPQQNLFSWFSNHKKVTFEATCIGKLQLWSHSGSPRNGTPDIRSWCRETGVIFPDDLSIDPSWDGADPFAKGRTFLSTTKRFTEKLPPKVEQKEYMERFVVMAPSSTRENKSIARREKKPEWLTMEQYLCFSHMRAGPYSQVRCLVEAIHDSLLPFQHDCVHILIKQLLFQVGNGWKIDLRGDWNGFDRLCDVLSQQMNLLRNSPKDCDRVLLFGFASSFLGQNDRRCRGYSIEFAGMCATWADDIKAEVEDSDLLSPQLYWKQAKLYGYALLCMSFGCLEDSNAIEIANLIVQFRSKALFASEEPSSTSLNQAILQVMSSHIGRVLDAVTGDTSRLSHCLSLVIERLPTNLEWSPVQDPSGSLQTACFETTWDSHLYSINLLTGTVLVDGTPPVTLPSSVTEDDLYKRTFGTRNFEVEILGFRHYQAARCVDNHFKYEFIIDSSDSLHIIEKNMISGDNLMLLRRNSMDLPVLLQEKHSHWFCSLRRVVLMRDPFYCRRQMTYVATEQETYCLPPRYSCSTLSEVVGVLPDCERLVFGETRLLTSLEKFEPKKYIHLYLSCDKASVRYTLPRFRLAFMQMEDGVKSLEFTDYSLLNGCVLKDTIPGLKAFMVLSHSNGQQRVLIPDGIVHAPSTKIEISQKWEDMLNYHVYDVHHRFGHLVANTTIGRLQLASLYASSGTALADRRMGKTTHTIACELVRQCWRNEPFSAAELAKLVQLSTHSNLCCTLKLLCNWLWASSISVHFLYDAVGKIAVPEDEHRTIVMYPELEFDVFALDEYRQSKHAPLLLEQEELSLLGTKQSHLKVPLPDKLIKSGIVSFVQDIEERVYKMYIAKKRKSGIPRHFPLERPSSCTGLEQKVYDEMEESYRRFALMTREKVQILEPNVLKNMNLQVQNQREKCEKRLVDSLREGRSLEFQMSRLSGGQDSPTPLDLLRIIYDGTVIECFAPSMSQTRRRDMRVEAIHWAILCVLEDKLHRLLRIDLKADGHSALLELTAVRKRDPIKHPRWLAFEVEQNLQIRPNQYSIVEQLLRQPNSVIQLNMGLGKTRVLVPMLILEYMSNEGIARVNMLPSIIHEAMEYYRAVLVASVQNIKLFSLPFTRDICLDSAFANLLQDEIEKCKAYEGCFVVTAQQRNSLMLKQYDQDIFVDGLKGGCFLDILDESDAILDVDYQLVYALGAQTPLPAGPSRWAVLQTLLMCLSRKENDNIKLLIQNPSLIHHEKSICGSFAKIRLLLPFHGHENQLAKAVGQQLVDCPTYELRWIRHIPQSSQDLFLRMITDPTYEGTWTEIEKCELFKENQSCILAARGFLAYGLLFHGLQARYRVAYGLNPQSKTRMAVPFAASDTPKPRSQYSHPDMCLVYTALSYYYNGLSESQLREALQMLQSMGVTAQEVIYNEWIASAKKDIPPKEWNVLDNIKKIDVNNAVQFKLVYKNLRYCMESINFWTNNFVYPNDTSQFPSRRGTSAWHVCDTGRVVGFSGTDDNRFLLPLSVEQIPQEEDHLRATNGEMVCRILDCTTAIHQLKDASGEGDVLVLWQVVLIECVNLSVSALIDVAGLMAGSENDEVAQFLANQLDPTKFRGLVYFDTQSNVWTVFEIENQRSIDLRSSALTERECFVYFDESRCRGSDMKLKPKAVAMVTLDPKLTKDRFLQGAARMRQLRVGGQSLILAGTSEVVYRDSTVKQVLEKILHYTTTKTKEGVVKYCQRGLEYHDFPKPIEDDVSLRSMYAQSIPEYANLGDFLDASYAVEDLSQDALEVVEYCKDIGGGLAGGTHQHTEECEQELENEVECEEQEEISIERQDPFAQTDWKYELAFSDPDKFFRDGTFRPLASFIQENVQRLSEIEWSSNLYCTPNFIRTIETNGSGADLSLYLRPANGILVMQDGRVVLISGYELNALLPIWWESNGENLKATLQHVFTCAGEGFGHDRVSIPEETMAFLKLFRGYVQFTDNEQNVLREKFTKVNEVELVILELLNMRNRLTHYDRSDLEAIATWRHPSP